MWNTNLVMKLEKVGKEAMEKQEEEEVEEKENHVEKERERRCHKAKTARRDTPRAFLREPKPAGRPRT